MTPAGSVIALAVCFVVAVLCERHGQIHARKTVRRLRKENTEAWNALNLAIDAHDRQQARAEHWFGEAVEFERQRDAAVRRERETATRIVSLPRGAGR